MDSQNSCLSWVVSFEENDLVGPPNPWFDYYQYVPPSPTISMEMDPNWGRELNSEDEEIEGLFDLQLHLQDLYIENIFPSSDEEYLDDADQYSLRFNLLVLFPYWIKSPLLSHFLFGMDCFTKFTLIFHVILPKYPHLTYFIYTN